MPYQVDPTDQTQENGHHLQYQTIQTSQTFGTIPGRLCFSSCNTEQKQNQPVHARRVRGIINIDQLSIPLNARKDREPCAWLRAPHPYRLSTPPSFFLILFLHIFLIQF